MSYLFDLEDFGTFCRASKDNIIKSMHREVEYNKELYYEQYGTYDGYTPKQETLYFNTDGSISIYLFDNNLNTKTLFDIGRFCCTEEGEIGNIMRYILENAKSKLGLFPNIDTDTFYWDSNNQSCRWRPIEETCPFDTYKIALNPVFDDGALFNFEKNDKSCSLTIDFSYLFKFDCETLSKLIVTPDTDANTLQKIKDLEIQLAEANTECETISSNLTLTIDEFNNTPYSLEKNGIYYCIDEDNGGLNQLENLLGPLKFKKFINGEPEAYTSSDVTDFMTLNNQSISNFNKELMYECSIPYGTKSELKHNIDKLTDELFDCQLNVSLLEQQLLDAKETTTQSVSCASPINNLESLDISITLDVIESDGSVKTVTEIPLLQEIGDGNLYDYLVEKQENSGFYFCSLPKSTETWTTGCTSLMAYELTAPNGLPNTETNLNVSTCNTVKDSLLTDLLFESPFGTTEADVKAFNETLHKQSFASNWINFSYFISDETIIEQIKNKKIKLSISVNNSCGYICVYIDNIKMTKECVNGESKKITISKSPGFELEKIIDNKKSWVNNTIRVNREFEIENINNLTVFRKTDYDVDDERLIINTKEIDLNINIASAIENDVQCFINDNPSILESVPSNDCGCLLECYEDVFQIIDYYDAVDQGIIPPISDEEDLITLSRTVRDAWLKALNELMLATAPYLDIINGIQTVNPSEDTMTTYRATRDAYIKALGEFNFASGGGYIEGLTVNEDLGPIANTAYTYNNFTSFEKIAPQMFNTKCGRIFKMSFASEGFIYFVETPEKELKVFWVNSDFAPKNTTWIDISGFAQQDYYLTGGTPIYPREKASYYCKFLPLNNYVSWAQMNHFHYQNNNNAAHNEWINSVENSFFIEWDDKKGKCMTNMYKEVVPEQFSMHYPIISKNFWKFYEDNGTPTINPDPYAECQIDTIFRNYSSTACTINPWPNDDIASLYRTYRNENNKLASEIITSLTRQPEFPIYVIDPLTNMAPDETNGIIPVKVTTTIRKDSLDGEIVFKEEYVLNNTGSTCTYCQPISDSITKLTAYVGITDPNSAYWNPNAKHWDFINDCSSSEFGTLLSGSTSTLPLAGASDNGVDRNWQFDKDYYIHFDVVNNNTNEVYFVTNNDYNLRDRHMPIICPSSASTQTFDINTALSSITTFTNTILGEIQDDLDDALNNCTIC